MPSSTNGGVGGEVVVPRISLSDASKQKAKNVTLLPPPPSLLTNSLSAREAHTTPTSATTTAHNNNNLNQTTNNRVQHMPVRRRLNNPATNSLSMIELRPFFAGENGNAAAQQPPRFTPVRVPPPTTTTTPTSKSTEYDGSLGLVVYGRYTIKAEQEGDLEFQKGDMIQVFHKKPNWWKGKNLMTGLVGIFSSNYVVPEDPFKDRRQRIGGH
jgi:hypothetical protein